ncbi:MAG: sulfatase-like hydrolase/transferase [Candidatus Omnitrophica bacterium]|nr:sulfatase-like hydrolase/transferase [Candidatus Omnitrophota bacterium]
MAMKNDPKLLLAILVIFSLSFKFLSVSKGKEIIPLKGKQNYNVVLIMASNLRPDHLGCYGYNKQTSPAIDEIAKDSVLFENAFSQAAYTFPSTMSIFTSLYPSSHGMIYVFKDKLSPRVQTLAEIFGIYSYRTAWFSLLKASHLNIDVGFGRGFQDKGELGILFDGRNNILSWLESNKDNKFFLAMDARRVHAYYHFLRQAAINNEVLDYSNIDKMTKEEIEIDKVFYNKLVKLAKSKKPPFDDAGIILNHKELFNGKYNEDKTENIRDLLSPDKKQLWYEIQTGIYVSWPNRAVSKDPESWIAAYDDSILAVDQELIKPIIDKLKLLGLYDKTIIIITSNHAEAFGEHGIYGHGCPIFDEFTHIPLIIKMPAIKRGRRIKELVQSIDIMPTVLEMAGIEVPHQAQGKSLVSLMKGESACGPNEYIFVQDPAGRLIRSKEWKLYVGSDYGFKEKVLHPFLFHLTVDPREQRNVYSVNQDVVEKLSSELKQWESSIPSYKDYEYPFSPEVDKVTQEKIRKTGYW